MEWGPSVCGDQRGEVAAWAVVCPSCILGPPVQGMSCLVVSLGTRGCSFLAPITSPSGLRQRLRFPGSPMSGNKGRCSGGVLTWRVRSPRVTFQGFLVPG